MNTSDRFARAGRRGAVLGAAALLTGVVLAPVAAADEAQTGTLADALLQTVASASASVSGETVPEEGKRDEGARVTVSQTVLSAEGEHEITVTGTGFTGDGIVATRPPLAPGYPGAYVVLGTFDDQWKPTEAAAGSTRRSITQFWAVHAEDVQTVGGASRGAIVMDPDGSFTTTFTLSKELVDAAAEADAENERVTGNLGIYTYAGGGATVAEWETYTPISFADPVTWPLGSLADLFPAS